MASFWDLMGAPRPFDPSHRFLTSPFLPTLYLALLRLLLGLYALVTIITILAWDTHHSDARDARRFWSYFTDLTYCGLACYFLVAGVHGLSYALQLPGAKSRPVISEPRPQPHYNLGDDDDDGAEVAQDVEAPPPPIASPTSAFDGYDSDGPSPPRRSRGRSVLGSLSIGHSRHNSAVVNNTNNNNRINNNNDNTTNNNNTTSASTSPSGTTKPAIYEGGSWLHNLFPRPLQALHSLFYTTIITFPFLVTIVFWSILYSPPFFPVREQAWSNISEHGLNSLFALLEIALTRTQPPPLLHLPLLILLLALYLALAYITRASEGFYVYSFLDPHADGSGRVAGYVFGILIGTCVIFALVWVVVWARLKLCRRLRRDWDRGPLRARTMTRRRRRFPNTDANNGNADGYNDGGVHNGGMNGNGNGNGVGLGVLEK